MRLYLNHMGRLMHMSCVLTGPTTLGVQMYDVLKCENEQMMQLKHVFNDICHDEW